jgi:hypothetical protein
MVLQKWTFRSRRKRLTGTHGRSYGFQEEYETSNREGDCDIFCLGSDKFVPPTHSLFKPVSIVSIQILS